MNESTAKLIQKFAELPPWEDPPEPVKTPPKSPLSFSDLQEGLRSANNGDDSSLRNGLLIIMGLIIILAIVLHYRQRRKTAGPPDSTGKLGWELSRLIKFPFGTRMLLWWVARTTQTPFAALLISRSLFDNCVQQWSLQPTFSLARRWGKARLESLKPVLFAS